jgi:hypothetical protein
MMKGPSDFKSGMMACSCDVVRNFIVHYGFSIIALIKIKVFSWAFDFSYMLELPYKNQLNFW